MSQQPCPGDDSQPLTRRALCASYNNRSYQGHFHRWVPYFRDAEECELNCRPLGYQFYTTLAQSVADGTPCSAEPGVDKVCVNGICTVREVYSRFVLHAGWIDGYQESQPVVGCDGVVGSGKVFDRCGVCGGDNSTCSVVKFEFTRPELPVGYNLITRLPQGACDINVTEMGHSRNYLALRSENGFFILNGNWIINWSGQYDGAGTTFHYRRHDGRRGEAVQARGPLTERVDLMLIYQQPKAKVVYQYVLPLSAPAAPLRRAKEAAAREPVSFRWKLLGQGACSQSCGGGVREPRVVCFKFPSLKPAPPEMCDPKKRPQPVACNPQPCPPTRWSTGPWSNCSSSGCGGFRSRTVSCKKGPCPSSSRPADTEACSPPCPAHWAPGPWQKRHQPEVTAHRVPAYIQLSGQEDFCSDSEVGAQCSAQCGRGLRKRELRCLRGNTTVFPGECGGTPPPTEEPCDTKPCQDGWFFSPWPRALTGPEHSWPPQSDHKPAGFQCPCGGVQRRTVACVVAQGTCDPLKRPSDTRHCKPCDPRAEGRWFASPWSQCSVTCGNGTKVRELVCLKQEKDGFWRSAPGSCSSALRPTDRRRCQAVGPCGDVPQWLVTEWLQCSNTCQTSRKVACTSPDGRSSTTCPAVSRPEDRRACGSKECVSQEQRGTRNKLEYSLAAQAVRRSRRLQGLEPQENIAMIKQETQTKMGEYHFQPFRNPSIFTGERNQNPEKWLKEFHRVARYNCWDDSMCLANVYFSSKEQRTDGTKMLKRKLIHGIFL
ncbi:THSD4 [Cordylochernes scorpioides]|uniref:THSD4 n=1 Tax=Cordylochernes scorpioides TaxID=51811 RepID=A0ABY6JVZ1_9ARAC|nr:THSD4 [Cordylochernes scorpioides]